MSDPTSIFGTNTPSDPGNNGNSNVPNVQIDPAIATLLGEIKDERGEPKYKTLNDALVALKHSQEHIPQLNQKLTQTTEELEALRTAAGKFAEIEKAVQALTQRVEAGATPPNAAITEEQIASLVTKTLTKAQQEALATTNISTVVNTMKTKFGTEAQKVYEQKAQELGITVAEFNALAAKTPMAVLKLVGAEGVQVPQNTGAPTAPSVNTGGFQPKPNSEVGRNPKGVMIGATAQELKEESAKAAALVNELHASGKTVHDLTDPKVYFATFGKG